MSTVVDYGQRVFALVRIVVDLSLVTKEDFFDFVHAQVRHFQDILAVVGKTVAFNLLFKELDVGLHVKEIFDAELFRVAVVVYSHIADGRVVKVAKDKALAFVWREVRHAGFLRLAEHFECCWVVESLFCFLLMKKYYEIVKLDFLIKL